MVVKDRAGPVVAGDQPPELAVGVAHPVQRRPVAERAQPGRRVEGVAAVGSVIGAMTVAGIVAQERGDPPEELLAASRRAVEFAVRGLSGSD